MIGLWLLTPMIFATDNIDLGIDRFSIQEEQDGLVTIDVAVRVRICGLSGPLISEVDLWMNNTQIDSRPVDVIFVDSIDDDIGGNCANTRNGSCEGVACPDAIVNGKKRKGNCEDGTIGGLCACDYGVATVSFISPAVRGATYELFLDKKENIAERNETNNYGRFSIKDTGSDEPGPLTFKIHDQTLIEEILNSGLVNRMSAKDKPVARYLEQRGDETYLIQRTKDAEGNCKAKALSLNSLDVKNSCKGAPCEQCRFRYSGSIIIGCRCLDANDDHICNHSISEESHLEH
ncbi:MAG: hypothetical protein QNK37_11590 [Acidobacteriota bacterium]|nr:hypothetical protein [Acidobacteriota bacterium]